MKKKILVASDFYTPHWTGIVKSISNAIEVLSDEYDFTVITVQHIDSLPRREMIGGAEVMREPYLLKLSRAFYSFKVVLRFFSEMPKAECVLISSPCTNVLPISLLTKLFGKRLVIFHQGDLVLGEGIKNKIIEKLFYFSTLTGMALADVVSTYTRDYAEQSVVLNPFMEKFHELLMPMLLEPKEGDLPESLIPLKCLKQEGKFIFGFGGRFVDEKGFDVLFRAIPLVVQELKDVQFVFAGETQVGYEETFTKLGPLLEPVKEHVTFLGLLKKDELTWFYELIDWIVISSRTDCCPLVQMEACLAGKPSVCSNIPGAREIVRRTGFGMLFESENHEDLAKKLIEAYRSGDAYQGNWEKVQALLDVKRLQENLRSAFGNAQ